MIINNGMVVTKINSSTSIGLTIAKTPITRKILAIFEPMTLPTAISLWPFLAAETVPANSGKLTVPTATTLKPITTSETPMKVAISTADFTVSCAPNNRAIKPPTNNG